MNNYPNGVDVVWIGLDNKEYIAAFITAGIAPIPNFVIQNKMVLIEDIEEIVLKINKSSDVFLNVAIPKPNIFLELSKRGLYVYDWTDVEKKSTAQKNAYELVATPSIPLHYYSLKDTNLKEYLENIKFDLVDFKTNIFIDVKQYLVCLKSKDS